MWQLDNRSPFAADSGWIRDTDGAEVWVVAVKATYAIAADGTLRIADDQPPVQTGPVVDPASGALLHETDLGPAKAATDVLLHGCAYPPDGRPVRQMSVGFRIGPLERTAVVFGDRRWKGRLLTPTVGETALFVCMPLDVSRALGGDDPDDERFSGNPIGRGLGPGPEGPMPNLEHAERRLRSPSDRPPVVAFGPVPRHWPWRLRHAGTYDSDWEAHRSPLLPTNLDPRFWQVAPPEQQIAPHLRGGEPVVLVNLTQPGFVAQSQLRFTLPTLSLGFETRFLDGEVVRSRSRIHTVILEPEYPRVSVVHHMALPCHPKVNRLDYTRITVKRRPLDAEDIHDPARWPASGQGIDGEQGA